MIKKKKRSKLLSLNILTTGFMNLFIGRGAYLKGWGGRKSSVATDSYCITTPKQINID